MSVPWDHPDADPLADLLRVRDEAERWPPLRIVVPPPITERVKQVYGPDWRDRFTDEWLFQEHEEER